MADLAAYGRDDNRPAIGGQSRPTPHAQGQCAEVADFDRRRITSAAIFGDREIDCVARAAHEQHIAVWIDRRLRLPHARQRGLRNDLYRFGGSGRNRPANEKQQASQPDEQSAECRS